MITGTLTTIALALAAHEGITTYEVHQVTTQINDLYMQVQELSRYPGVGQAGDSCEQVSPIGSDSVDENIVKIEQTTLVSPEDFEKRIIEARFTLTKLSERNRELGARSSLIVDASAASGCNMVALRSVRKSLELLVGRADAKKIYEARSQKLLSILSGYELGDDLYPELRRDLASVNSLDS